MTGKEIKKVIKKLKAGDLIAILYDTLYGTIYDEGVFDEGVFSKKYSDFITFFKEDEDSCEEAYCVDINKIKEIKLIKKKYWLIEESDNYGRIIFSKKYLIFNDNFYDKKEQKKLFKILAKGLGYKIQK
jgi:hypothetical protein